MTPLNALQLEVMAWLLRLGDFFRSSALAWGLEGGLSVAAQAARRRFSIKLKVVAFMGVALLCFIISASAALLLVADTAYNPTFADTINMTTALVPR